MSKWLDKLEKVATKKERPKKTIKPSKIAKYQGLFSAIIIVFLGSLFGIVSTIGPGVDFQTNFSVLVFTIFSVGTQNFAIANSGIFIFCSLFYIIFFFLALTFGLGQVYFGFRDYKSKQKEFKFVEIGIGLFTFLTLFCFIPDWGLFISFFIHIFLVISNLYLVTKLK